MSERFVIGDVVPVDNLVFATDENGFGTTRYHVFFLLNGRWNWLNPRERLGGCFVDRRAFEVEKLQKEYVSICDDTHGQIADEAIWAEIVNQLGHIPVVQGIIDYRARMARKAMPQVCFAKGTCSYRPHPQAVARIGGSESSYNFLLDKNGNVLEGWGSWSRGANSGSCLLNEAEVTDVRGVLAGESPKTKVGRHFKRYMIRCKAQSLCASTTDALFGTGG
ncbi:MAG: hypothetical protein IPK84_02685 [Candidatus Moraniibacteriota bacterium]|nr:MAG: hypothetical protein IPK84_02685 [Candidatus Moranbacteria bacterium]